jgi:hypothetical protein
MPDLGVKGSRVQISPARQVNVGLSHLIRAAFIQPPAHPRQASAPGSWAQIGPPARVRHPDIEHGQVIRVKIAARHRRVLMAGHTLEKVQLDAGVGHPGQRRVSQAVPHEAGSPRSSTNSSHPVASRRVAVVITPPRGPTSSRASLALPTVSRSSVARSGSMIGNGRRLRPLANRMPNAAQRKCGVLARGSSAASVHRLCQGVVENRRTPP